MKQKRSGWMRIIIATSVLVLLGSGVYYLYQRSFSEKEPSVYVQSVSSITSMGSVGIYGQYNGIVEAKDVIEIKVEKYPSLISYHGKYFYRSGTTMRTISGKELDRLLLKQHGKTWDAVPMHKLKARDLDSGAIRFFKDEAVRHNRLSRKELNVSREILMDTTSQQE